MAENTIHPFEKAGLGKAPYRFIGMNEKVFQIPGQPAKAGGCCDYCFNGIRYEYHVRSADGREFKVGCDCIAKIERKGSKLLTDVEKAAAKARKALAAASLAARTARVVEALASDPEYLTSLPHPNPKMAGWGKTMRNYAEWMLANAGAKGKTEVCKLVEKLA